MNLPTDTMADYFSPETILTDAFKEEQEQRMRGILGHYYISEMGEGYFFETGGSGDENSGFIRLKKGSFDDAFL